MKKINSLKFILFGILFLFLSPALGFSELGNLLQKFGVSKSTTLNDTKIGAGLKEALKVGVDKTVQLTGKKDGYLSNEAWAVLKDYDYETFLSIIGQRLRRYGKR